MSIRNKKYIVRFNSEQLTMYFREEKNYWRWRECKMSSIEYVVSLLQKFVAIDHFAFIFHICNGQVARQINLIHFNSLPLLFLFLLYTYSLTIYHSLSHCFSLISYLFSILFGISFIYFYNILLILIYSNFNTIFLKYFYNPHLITFFFVRDSFLYVFVIFFSV